MHLLDAVVQSLDWFKVDSTVAWFMPFLALLKPAAWKARAATPDLLPELQYRTISAAFGNDSRFALPSMICESGTLSAPSTWLAVNS